MIFEQKDGRNPLDEVFIPLHAEQVSIGQRQVATGRVKVSVVTHSREELVEQLLENEVEVDGFRLESLLASFQPCEQSKTSSSSR